MKKFFAVFIFILTIHSLSAQHFGIKGGLNLAKTKISSDGISLVFDNITSFHLGLVYDTPIYKNFYFNPNILFSQKGYKVAIMHTDMNTRINYIQVPLNFTYKYETSNIKLYALAGPFISYAVSGKESGNQLNGMGLYIKVDGPLNFGNHDYEYNRFDAGIGLGAGIEFKKFQIGVGYDFGLFDIQNVSDSKTFTRNFQMSVCYFF